MTHAVSQAALGAEAQVGTVGNPELIRSCPWLPSSWSSQRQEKMENINKNHIFSKTERQEHIFKDFQDPQFTKEPGRGDRDLKREEVGSSTFQSPGRGGSVCRESRSAHPQGEEEAGRGPHPHPPHSHGPDLMAISKKGQMYCVPIISVCGLFPALTGSKLFSSGLTVTCLMSEPTTFIYFVC